MRTNSIPVTGIYFTSDKFDHTETIDLFPICDMIYWAVMVQISFGKNPDIFGEGWKKDIIPIKIAAGAVAAATRKASGHICLNRLWNITLVSEREEQDIPGLMDLANGERYAQLRHVGHESCIPERCDYTSLDATRVTQHHKCPETDTDCRMTKIHFDPSLLEKSIKTDGGTVWSINAPFRVLRDTKYIAISHVWADGTGVGLEPAGRVNACLFGYFAEIARSLDCQGIWWDTISIPTNPRLRGKAINEMHNNYSHAQYTVLHDSYLAGFEWADDGTPALAVMLSPWFTRGWTALECIMSQKIKVIFKKPGSEANELVLKDLDEDVLAKDPSRCSRGHWIASTIIRRLRQPAEKTSEPEITEEATDIIQNVSDLLAILKPRNTSWSRDRMVIAGLLAGVEVDYSMSAAVITKKICEKLKYINPVSLLHEKTPIAETGPWSWCPKYLYDMPASPPSDFHEKSHQGVIHNGTLKLTSLTWYRRVTREDVVERRIVSCSTHPSISYKIETTLEEVWHNCLLLELTPKVSLLVTTIGGNDPVASAAASVNGHRAGEVLACRYIGSVRAIGAKTFHENHILGISNCTSFIIGSPSDFPEIDISNNLRPLNHLPRSRHAIQHAVNWSEQVWIGDRMNGELLIPKRIKERCPFGNLLTVAMHEVEVTYSPTDEGIQAVLAPEPCFAISDGGLIAKVSKAWSLENPLYSLVGVGLRWPPPSIPSTERVERRSKSILQRVVDFSEYSFKLEFSRDTFTYSAIRKEYIEPSDAHPYRGIWACIFPDGAYELHLFHQPDPVEIIATRITRVRGHLPAGSPTFQVMDIENQLSQDSNREVDCDICQKLEDDNSPKWASRYFRFVDYNTIDMVPDPDLEEEEGEDILWKYRRVPSTVFFPPENTRPVTPPRSSRNLRWG
ncbi:hypothetical protein TWF281_001835 [Arthrobotrys megalospora]